MNVIELDDGVRIGSYGIAEINGHHVAFGANPDKYQAKCLSCEKEFNWDDEYFRLSGLDAQNFQLYSFYYFVDKECPEPRESISKIISDKVMVDHVGSIADNSAQISIESEIEDILGVGMKAETDFSDISRTMDVNITMNKPVKRIDQNITVNTQEN